MNPEEFMRDFKRRMDQQDFEIEARRISARISGPYVTGSGVMSGPTKFQEPQPKPPSPGPIISDPCASIPSTITLTLSGFAPQCVNNNPIYGSPGTDSEQPQGTLDGVYSIPNTGGGWEYNQNTSFMQLSYTDPTTCSGASINLQPFLSMSITCGSGVLSFTLQYLLPIDTSISGFGVTGSGPITNPSNITPLSLGSNQPFFAIGTAIVSW